MPILPENTMTTRCTDCGTAFVCGAVVGHSTCWCMEKPTLTLEPGAAAVGCYCSTCLEQRLSAQTSAPAA
ncbi:hypothetical protein E4Q08_13195 [Candidatus Accumulibacter phosphatis]|uniref:Cysteine-rich CWC family protein n=2 Tax=Candidatus Accumulibacter contiguus TaxID=2954381 RepID=A0ABX1TAM5_9PROT|nr:cysteine-rich CWC family protein [Accumulibacter sp.]NMQ06134.1 hypothetical protein [Candidatus Accumulibacter contiguus]